MTRNSKERKYADYTKINFIVNWGETLSETLLTESRGSRIFMQWGLFKSLSSLLIFVGENEISDMKNSYSFFFFLPYKIDFLFVYTKVFISFDYWDSYFVPPKKCE